MDFKNQARPKVKICCISSEIEAELASRYGASVIGLVGPMPSGPGIISNEMIHQIASNIPSPISTFLLTSETRVEKIIAHYKKVNTDAIQLVDTVDHQAYETIRKELPQVELVQVIHVIDETSIMEAVAVSKFVDFLLLDSGNPKAAVKILGGSGRTHNWELSRKIRKSVSVPVYLAGGINAKNVAQAIQTVQPYGIDLCSGVRTNDKLDENKLREFFRVINEI